MTEQHTPSLLSGGDVARYRELAIQRITYTHDEHGTAKLSAALHLTQQALAEAVAALTASEAERERLRDAAKNGLDLINLLAQSRTRPLRPGEATMIADIRQSVQRSTP